MYGSVPTIAPSRVSVQRSLDAASRRARLRLAVAAARERLRDAEVEHLDWPALVTKMFSGLRSRWTMPSSCARASARATGSISSTTRDAGSASPSPNAPIRSRSGWPSRNSSTMYGMPVELVDLVDDDDVLVVAVRGRARLDEEAIGDVARRVEQELDRDAAAELGVARGEHHAHAAAAELADQLVLVDATAFDEPHACAGAYLRRSRRLLRVLGLEQSTLHLRRERLRERWRRRRCGPRPLIAHRVREAIAVVVRRRLRHRLRRPARWCLLWDRRGADLGR